MLLKDDEKQELVNRIVAQARVWLQEFGVKRRDPETAFIHHECRYKRFIIVEHQRQNVRGGKVKTSGLDMWYLHGRGARKVLSVRYLPFQIKVFSQYDGGKWIEQVLSDQPTRPQPEETRKS